MPNHFIILEKGERGPFLNDITLLEFVSSQCRYKWKIYCCSLFLVDFRKKQVQRREHLYLVKRVVHLVDKKSVACCKKLHLKSCNFLWCYLQIRKDFYLRRQTNVKICRWCYLIDQAWATSGPRATYGPPSTWRWSASYIWSFLNRYIDYENTLNIKKVPVLLQKQI